MYCCRIIIHNTIRGQWECTNVWMAQKAKTALGRFNDVFSTLCTHLAWVVRVWGSKPLRPPRACVHNRQIGE